MVSDHPEDPESVAPGTGLQELSLHEIRARWLLLVLVDA